VLGVAISGTLFAMRPAFLDGYRLALGAGAGVAVLAGILSLVRSR
jgi:hypothetical protein